MPRHRTDSSGSWMQTPVGGRMRAECGTPHAGLAERLPVAGGVQGDDMTHQPAASRIGPPNQPRPWRWAIVLLVVVAASCGSDDEPDTGSRQQGEVLGAATCDSTPIEVDQVTPDPAEQVESALADRWSPGFPDPLVDPAAIRSGGPPPDGIPPIDNPKFVPACGVDFLADNEPVVVLTVSDETRAYPIQILTWHEIVNDLVGQVPVTVSFCPLCNSAFAFDRRSAGRTLDFGTSGSLYRSNLVMYDRQTESLWLQFTGEAVVGHLAGTELDIIPMSTVSWADFKEAHPDALVLSRDTGFDRRYGRNPYPGYDDVTTDAFLFDGELDERLQAKERIVGIRRGGDAVAVVREAALVAAVTVVDVGGAEVVVFAKPGTATALEGARVAGGRDVGAVGVFDPIVAGQRLTFEFDGEDFVDVQTGSRWNILGEAVKGQFEGRRLNPIEHDNSFWFAWSVFEPDSRILS